MFARKAGFSSFGRTAVMVAVAAMALTAMEPSLARADSAPSRKGLSTAASGATDISARRRGYGGGGGAAAAAAFAGIVGTGLAIAATQNRRSYYDSYDGGPAYYGGGPAYYGGGPGYYGGGYGYGRSRSEFGGQPTGAW